MHTKIGLVVGSLVVGLLAGAPAAGAASCDHVVVGTGAPEVDVPALQAALDGPHASDRVTVCIAGTLDFASVPPANVNVQIRPAHVDPATPMAEIALVGLDGATIRGGFNAVGVPTLRAAGVINDVGAIRLSGFRVEDATSSAVLVFRVNGSLEISDVVIDRVRSSRITLPNGVSFDARIGINVTSFPGDPNSHVTGTVTIRGVEVHAGPYASDGENDAAIIAPLGIGVLGFPPRPLVAKVLIEDSKATGWSGSGIGLAYVNDAVVRDNRVTTGTFANDVTRLPNPPLSPCAGQNGLGAAGGIVVVGPGNVLIADNAIEMRPALTASGVPPACASGVLLTLASGTIVHDVKVRAGHAPTARGLVVVQGAGNGFDDIRVENAAIGISVSGASDVSFHDINIRGTPICDEVSGSTGIVLDDIRC
jgi:hypothetical protein